MDEVLFVWQSTPMVLLMPGSKANGHPKPICASVSGVLDTGTWDVTSLAFSSAVRFVACERIMSLGDLSRS